MGLELAEPSSSPLLVQHAKEEPFDLEEFFQSLPKRQHRALWAALLELTQHTAEGFGDDFDEEQVSCYFSVITKKIYAQTLEATLPLVSNSGFPISKAAR